LYKTQYFLPQHLHRLIAKLLTLHISIQSKDIHN